MVFGGTLKILGSIPGNQSAGTESPTAIGTACHCLTTAYHVVLTREHVREGSKHS
jgi:hypothetical protein